MKGVELKPKIIQKIQKHKKLFEKYETYDYTFKYKNKDFYFVGYYRFNKDQGILIICKDDTASNEEICTAFKMMYNFNRVMTEALRQMIPDIQKPVSVMQELRELLSQAEHVTEPSMNDVQDELLEIYSTLDIVIYFPDELLKLIKEMQAIEKDVLDRGYLLTENVERMMELNVKHYQIMYNQGRQQLNCMEHVETVKKHIIKKSKESSLGHKSNIKLLINYLELFLKSKSEHIKSLSTFEKDEHGNKITFSPGEKGLEEYKDMYYKRVNHILENHIKNHLRNFS